MLVVRNGTSPRFSSSSQSSEDSLQADPQFLGFAEGGSRGSRGSDVVVELDKG